MKAIQNNQRQSPQEQDLLRTNNKLTDTIKRLEEQVHDL